jgi:hypothetical protein
MNEADQQFLKNHIDAELQVSDITQVRKENVPSGNGKKPKKGKKMILAAFIDGAD